MARSRSAEHVCIAAGSALLFISTFCGLVWGDISDSIAFCSLQACWGLSALEARAHIKSMLHGCQRTSDLWLLFAIYCTAQHRIVLRRVIMTHQMTGSSTVPM